MNYEGSPAITRSFSGLREGLYRLIVTPPGREQEVYLRNGQPVSVMFELSGLSRVDVDVLGAAGSADVLWGYGGSPETPYRRSLGPGGTARFWCEPGVVHARLFGDGVISDLVYSEVQAGKSKRIELIPRQGELGRLVVGLWGRGGHMFAAGPSPWDGLSVVSDSGEGVLLAKRFGSEGTRANYGLGLVEPDWSRVELVVYPKGLYRISTPNSDRVFEVWIGDEVGTLEILVGAAF